MANKLKGFDVANASPDQMKKIAAVLAQSAKQTKLASKTTATALKSLSAAQSGLKTGEKLIKDLED